MPDHAGAVPVYGPTDDFPFRSLIIDQPRKPAVDRVWVASASYGEDTYVEPDHIFPNLAAAALNEAGYPMEILNASRAGNSIASNIHFLNGHAADWAPRAAVLYQMSLDINVLAESLLGGGGAGSPGVLGDETAQEPQKKADPNGLVKLYESSTTFQTLKELVGGRATQERILAKSLGPRALPMFRQSVLDFVLAARVLGVEPILCTFATSHNANNLGQMPVDFRNAIFRYNIHLGMVGWVETIAEFNIVIAEVASEESLRLIDVGAALGGHPEFFRDYIHFNSSGHEAVAALLVAAFLDEAFLAEAESTDSKVDK